jgi:hypothetical protein
MLKSNGRGRPGGDGLPCGLLRHSALTPAGHGVAEPLGWNSISVVLDIDMPAQRLNDTLVTIDRDAEPVVIGTIAFDE